MGFFHDLWWNSPFFRNHIVKFVSFPRSLDEIYLFWTPLMISMFFRDPLLKFGFSLHYLDGICTFFVILWRNSLFSPLFFNDIWVSFANLWTNLWVFSRSFEQVCGHLSERPKDKHLTTAKRLLDQLKHKEEPEMLFSSDFSQIQKVNHKKIGCCVKSSKFRPSCTESF